MWVLTYLQLCLHSCNGAVVAKDCEQKTFTRWGDDSSPQQLLHLSLSLEAAADAPVDWLVWILKT
jgi:hypothetical protein